MSKPKSNRLGMYADVRQILDAALAAGGGTFECDTHGAAVHWRQRAYRFRKLFAETLGLNKESPYDIIVMPRIPEDSSTVHITIRRSIGTFKPLEGGRPFQPVMDELDEAAAEIAAKIERGDLL